MKNIYFNRSIVFTLAALLFLATQNVNAQVSINALSDVYTQNFGSIANSGTGVTWSNNSTIQGFYLRTESINPTPSYTADDGTLNSNGAFSFGNGTNTDRSLGFNQGRIGGSNAYIGLRIRNNTGTRITGGTVTWTGEQWRNNAAGNQTIKLGYKMNASDLSSTSGFTIDDANFFTAPYVGATATALDGNNSSNRAQVTNSFTVNMEPNEELMLIWYMERLSNMDVMSVDDISISFVGLPQTPVALPATDITSSSFRTNWLTSQYATGYYLTWYTTDYTYGAEDIYINGAGTSSYLVSDAPAGSEIIYEIRAYNSGSSTYSASTSNQVTTYTESSDPDYIFLGTVDNLWNRAANWSSNLVPGNTNSVIIRANCYVNIGNAVCNNMLIETDRMLTVGFGQNLTVNGEITEEGSANPTRVSIIIESNGILSSSTGNLMHHTDGIRGRIHRNTGGLFGEYHLVSVPLNTNTETEYSATFLGSYLARYNESANNWIQMNTPTDNIIYRDRGYMVMDPEPGGPGDPPYTYEGIFNQNQVSFAVSYTASNRGWNLVGNPYPSTIDWNSSTGWTKTNIDNTVYTWNGSDGYWQTYINGSSVNGGSRYIAPGQGFMVRTNSASPALIINYNARTTQTVSFFKSSNEEAPNSLRIKSIVNEKQDEALIVFNEQSTSMFDRNYDAYNLSPLTGTLLPDVYTLDADLNRYSINAMPYNNEDKTVDLAFKIGTDESVSFRFTGIETFTGIENLKILLEDTKTNYTQLLSENPEYSFAYYTSDDPARFKIHFAKTTGLFEQPSVQKYCQVFAINGELHIQYSSLSGNAGTAQIYDISGRTIASYQLNGNGSFITSVPFRAGAYLVKLSFSGHSEAHKVIISE